jgi:hypothetical protein
VSDIVVVWQPPSQTIERQAREIERLQYQLGLVRKSRDHWLKKYESLKDVVLKELGISDD